MSEEEREDDSNTGKGPDNYTRTPASTSQQEYEPRDKGVTDQSRLPDFEDWNPGTSSDSTEEADPLENVDLDNSAVVISDGENSQNVGDGSSSESDSRLPSEFYDSDLTPEVPDNVNIDNVDEFRGIDEEAGESGASDDGMVVGITDDGTRMFITRDVADAIGNVPGSNSTVKTVVEEIGDEQVQSLMPEINIDDEREAVVLEDVGGEDSKSVQGWLFDNRGKADDVDWDKESYVTAAATKILVGDTDLSGNIVTSSEGKFHPIDFDLAGKDLERSSERIADKDSGINAEYDGVVDKATARIDRQTKQLPFDVDERVLDERVEELANTINTDELEERLETDTNITRRKKESTMKNIKKLQDGLDKIKTDD